VGRQNEAKKERRQIFCRLEIEFRFIYGCAVMVFFSGLLSTATH